jgi:cellulose synthase operon protein C
MTRTPDEVRQLIYECENAPYGAGQIALAEEAIRHADALDDTDLRFDARMAGTQAYHMGGEPAKAFVTFSWCLAEYDRNPGERTPWDDELLRWHFKWIVSSLAKFPEMPLERAYAVLDDMERRYRLGGHSLHAVYTLRWRVAHHVGDTAAAEEWYAKWCATPRDENSDCLGCDPTSKVEHLVTTGRDADAIALAEPVLAGELTCAEQPQAMLTELLLPYVRTGRLDQARDAHIRGYRGFRRHLADLAEIGQHIEFCALTGNVARGLEILERHLDWLERAPSPYAAQEFATAGGLLLRRLVEAGRGDLTVGDVAVADLATALTAQARQLAARFDARNGTAYQSGRVERRLSAAPLVEHLPLSAVDRARAALGRRAGAVAQPSVTVPSTTVPEAGLDELLDSAEEAYARSDIDRALVLWQAAGDRFGTGSTTTLQSGRIADGKATIAAIRDDDGSLAEQLWRTAAACYAEAGDDERRHLAQGRLGVVICELDRVAEGLPLVEESTARLRTSDSARVRAGAELRLAQALAAAGRTEESLAAIGAAESVEGLGDGDPMTEVNIALARARCLDMLGRLDEVVEITRSARDRARELGQRLAVIHASFALAFTLTRQDKPEEAVEAFEEVIARAAEPAGRTAIGDKLVRAARARRANLLAASPRAAEAIDDLVELIAEYVAEGANMPAAYTRFDLAIAYHNAEQPLDAAEAAEEAVRALDQIEATVAADRCRYLLATVYRELDQPEPALTLLDELAERLDGFDNLPARGQMHEEAAQILYGQDRDTTAAARFVVAADCYHSADLLLDEVRARRWAALSLRWVGDMPAATAQLTLADDLAERLPADDAHAIWERGMLGFDGARVLLGDERLDEALDRLAGVPERFRSIEAFGEAVQAEALSGELYIRMGRPVEAERLLRGVLNGVPEKTDLASHVAWLLTEALEAQGRTAEAQAIRDQYGIEAEEIDED